MWQPRIRDKPVGRYRLVHGVIRTAQQEPAPPLDALRAKTQNGRTEVLGHIIEPDFCLTGLIQIAVAA